MEICRAGTNNNQKTPDDMDTSTTVTGVVSVEQHQKGWHNEEQDVGCGVDELCYVGREAVVLLAPVNGAGAPLKMFPHFLVLL